MGVVKIAEDVYQNNMQFAHLDTATSLKVTGGSTSVQFNTSSDKHIVITPLIADAYVSITAASQAAPSASGSGNSLGKLIKLGSSYTTIIRKNEYISSSADLNVVALGEV
jgi:hypothetical protein|tara:strand:- start:1074 stop:1403 length:330 start_codon:yes stop_codon:yes gene_type:complete